MYVPSTLMPRKIRGILLAHQQGDANLRGSITVQLTSVYFV